MPFRRFFRRDKPHSEPDSPTSLLSNKEKKSLFGLKVIQAQQNPEPVYDVSGCSAPNLPNDTFTFCKILGKTSLIVKNNCLTSLETGGSLQDLSELKVLDASYNKIEKLPSNFYCLKHLKVLNLSFNNLKYLPDSFNALLYLEELYLMSNKFSKVPPVLCALPRLRVLSLKDNSISSIPKEISGLQCTLYTLELNFETIHNPSQDVLKNGLEGIMKYFCELEGIEYKGPVSTAEDFTENSFQAYEAASIPPVDDIMIEYMRKKQEQLRAQIYEEEKRRDLEKEQLESVLNNSSKSREELLQELNSSPFEISDYEEKKQEKILDQMKLKEKFRNEQDEQLDMYLSNTINKESLLIDISAQEDDLQNEVEAIVAAKENERLRLFKDLSKAEQATELALQEILNLQQSQKSLDFVNLIKEQDEEMQKILSGIAEISLELRRTDVLRAMQNSLLEDALAEAQREKIEKKQKSWLASFLKEGQLEEAHIEKLLNDRASDQEAFLANVLQEEEYQAEAFKLLLLKMDLKRNSVIRQIALIQYELTRLSSLELRKKRCGVQYGSTTMLDQRKTLVDLLKSLLKAKEDRDEELHNWVIQLSAHKSSELSSEDFWLLQYQKLMTMKPSEIAQAEADLDPKVHRILSMACALDLLPLFAKSKITFASLLDMTEKDFTPLNIGSATYHSIQRALHSYLLAAKLGPQEFSPSDEECVPSAPTWKEEERPPSAPTWEEEAITDLPAVKGRPSAPPLDAQFIETECVVCLNSDCRVLFLPCGHVCVCAICCQPLITCPLCRCNITDKCFINGQ